MISELESLQNCLVREEHGVGTSGEPSPTDWLYLLADCVEEESEVGPMLGGKEYSSLLRRSA